MEEVRAALTAANELSELGERQLEFTYTALKCVLLHAAADACAGERDSAGRERLLSYAVTGLTAVYELDFDALTRSVSAVERIFEKDPAGVYPRMAEQSRRHYRRSPRASQDIPARRKAPLRATSSSAPGTRRGSGNATSATICSGTTRAPSAPGGAGARRSCSPGRCRWPSAPFSGRASVPPPRCLGTCRSSRLCGCWPPRWRCAASRRGIFRASN